MVQRARKPSKRRSVKKIIKRKKKMPTKMAELKKSVESNQKSQWIAYRELHNQIDKAWKKLKKDVANHASEKALSKDKNDLLLLLGECNYMANECNRVTIRKKRKH